MCVRPGTPRFTCQAPKGLAYGDLILRLHALADPHSILPTGWSQQAGRRANLSSTIRRVAEGDAMSSRKTVMHATDQRRPRQPTTRHHTKLAKPISVVGRVFYVSLAICTRHLTPHRTSGKGANPLVSNKRPACTVTIS